MYVFVSMRMYIYVKTFNVLQVVEIPISVWYNIFSMEKEKKSTVMIIVDYVFFYVLMEITSNG